LEIANLTEVRVNALSAVEFEELVTSLGDAAGKVIGVRAPPRSI